jgi:hypothetical protein
MNLEQLDNLILKEYKQQKAPFLNWIGAFVVF